MKRHYEENEKDQPQFGKRSLQHVWLTKGLYLGYWKKGANQQEKGR